MSYKNIRKYSIILAVPAIFICSELLLRAFGFCDALLYNESELYEYIAQPNQDRYRFGAHIKRILFRNVTAKSRTRQKQLCLVLVTPCCSAAQ